jgi:hypothetical protein
MDFPRPDTALPAPRRRPARTFIVALLGLIILTVAILAFFVPRSSDEKMTWLTPAQMAQAKQPGPLMRLKYRLEGIIGPFRRFLRQKPKALVFIASDIFTLPSASSGQIDLGVPASTNIDGMRAWILLPDKLTSFRKRLKAMTDRAPVSSPRMSTADGVQSQMSVGNTVSVGGVPVLAGLTVDLIPKVAGDDLKLLVGVTDTETNANPSANPPSIKTNLAVACRTSVPNAGALVIDSGKSGEKHYWLVLQPILIDAAGKPIKPSHSQP